VAFLHDVLCTSYKLKIRHQFVRFRVLDGYILLLDWTKERLDIILPCVEATACSALGFRNAALFASISKLTTSIFGCTV